jgi:4,5:9,10-diseco-3-hydroxy-5,9,17-trioxoandrosta-1(10),2-diene-4-oate hydrolase
LNRQAVGAPEPVTWIDADGGRLAVIRRGRGTPVVCLHAIGHGARDFEALADRIGEDFEIVAIDWPGQGRSPSSVPPSAENYEALALAALDALGIGRAVLIGNSIGGAAALRVAACHQDRVIALALCNSGGLAEIGAFARFVIRCIVAFFRAGEEGKTWFGSAFNLYYRSVLPERPARAQRERIAKSAYEIAGVLHRHGKLSHSPMPICVT